MRIIINADDFGYSSDVNKAIKEAFETNLISSTTMLVNMPGFKEAAELAKSKLFKNRVGIHLNLFEGVPLTKEMQKCRIFCDENGTFHGKKIGFWAPLRINPNIIYNELYAQIEKVINVGIQPTHFDSHAHRHTNYIIGSIVIKLAKHFNIPSIRINSNIRGRKSLFSSLMISVYNSRLKRQGIKCVDYIGTIPDIANALPRLTGVVEVIAHPIDIDGISLDSEYKSDIKKLLSPFDDLEKIGYADL